MAEKYQERSQFLQLNPEKILKDEYHTHSGEKKQF